MTGEGRGPSYPIPPTVMSYGAPIPAGVPDQDAGQRVSRRVGNYEYHPVWDFIADQVWLR